MRITNKTLMPAESVREDVVDASGSYVIEVPEGARYEGVFLLKGETLKIAVHLTGKNAGCVLKIAYLSSTDLKNDIVCDVYHDAPETYSSQIVKGVLAENGTADYHGVIHIPFNSQKCEGSQNHRAVLLSDEAKVMCVPELEIYADDVKCAHGSAIGALDEMQLFYLQSRGIDLKEAQKMLIHGFLSDLLPGSFEPQIADWMVKHA